MAVEGWVGADFFAHGSKSGVVATPGEVSVSGSVQVVRYGDEYATRHASGRYTVSGVPAMEGNDFTIATWVELRPGDTERPIFARVNGSTEVALIVLADGTLQARFTSAAGGWRTVLVAPGRVDDGVWHHIAVTAEKDWLSRWEFTVWVDGVVSRSGRMSPGLFAPKPDFRMTTDILVGGRGSQYFNGDILGVAAWTEILAADEIVSQAVLSPKAGATRAGWGIILG